MEYCQHGDLAGFITSTPYKIDEGCAKDIVQQILEVQFLPLAALDSSFFYVKQLTLKHSQLVGPEHHGTAEFYPPRPQTPSESSIRAA